MLSEQTATGDLINAVRKPLATLRATAGALRCEQCGNIVDCGYEDDTEHMRLGDWPRCCGCIMIVFVGSEPDAPLVVETEGDMFPDRAC